MTPLDTERETPVRARTVQGFCAAYGVGPTTAYELLKDGRVQGVKVGKRTLILEDSAKAWLESLPTFLPTSRGLETGGRLRSMANSKNRIAR